MSVYHRFEPHDVLHSVIFARPHVSVVSGTTGWRGNTGVSGSVSLFGDIRSRLRTLSADGISVVPIDRVSSTTADGSYFISGSYPATSSIRFVKLRTSEAPNGAGVTVNDWYHEHLSPLSLLYGYYSRFNTDFTTSSNDAFCMYTFSSGAGGAHPFVGSANPVAHHTFVTSSFTLEARVKPTFVSGSAYAPSDGKYTVLAELGGGDFPRFSLYLTGSGGGKLGFSYVTGSFGFGGGLNVSFTSSLNVRRGVWQHVAVTFVDGTGSFFIDTKDAGTFVAPPSARSLDSQTSFDVYQIGVGESWLSAVSNDGFLGFISEARVWSPARSPSQLSSSYRSIYYASGSDTALKSYFRLNDGPYSTAHGQPAGSGALNSSHVVASLGDYNYDIRVNQVRQWWPSDDSDFVNQRNLLRDSPTMLKVLQVPSLFYGRQISSGSLRIVSNSYSEQGLIQVLVDDGRGGLYVSGSYCKGLSGEDTAGVKWNKVGNVFYSEGIIVITNKSLLDFGEVRDTRLSDVLTIDFDGEQRIPTNVFMCRLGAGQANASNNPTFSRLNPLTGKRELVPDSPTTYITCVGLYNEHRKLVAVAKLAQPIRKREREKLNVRLRLDF